MGLCGVFWWKGSHARVVRGPLGVVAGPGGPVFQTRSPHGPKGSGRRDELRDPHRLRSLSVGDEGKVGRIARTPEPGLAGVGRGTSRDARRAGSDEPGARVAPRRPGRG